MSEYTESVATIEVLNSIKVGDLVKINDWKRPLKVKGVSEHYIAMAVKSFGKVIYSIIEKKRWDGIKYNDMRGGQFHCGTDDWIFGDPYFKYNFDDAEAVNQYLQEFETNKARLSMRRAVPVYKVHVKAGGGS